jgi:hypothetical protein
MKSCNGFALMLGHKLCTASLVRYQACGSPKASADVSSQAGLGKTAGKDAQDDKPTYVSIIGRDASRELAAQPGHDAHAALETFGPRTEHLRELANPVVNRVH